MQKRAPTLGRIAILTVFVLSCFSLALYLWITFGGATPMNAEGYSVDVPFDEATQLADQADVRISGVNVGHVANIELPPDGSQAMATLEIDPKFAPLPENVRATLRAKTLLGETYIELTPGNDDVPTLPEGATLPKGQVARTVEIDEILSTFDKETRDAFRTWLQDSSVAIDGRGESLGNAFALLPDTFEGFEAVFRTLDTQKHAVRQLFSNGAVTFDALSERRGQLQSLIRNSNALMKTTAQRDQSLIDTFHAFPAFLDESRLTTARLREFAQNADPLMQQLTPAAKQLSPTLIALGDLAPQLEGLFKGLRPVIRNSRTAFPAFQKFFRKDFPPLLRSLDPFLRNLNPLIDEIRLYRHEMTALLGNAAAASNAASQTGDGSRAVRYLRTMTTLAPETVATYPQRLLSNRNNPYPHPGATQLEQGLESYSTSQCSGGFNAVFPDWDDPAWNKAAFLPRTHGDAAEAEDLLERLQRYTFGGSSQITGVPAADCVQQPKFKPLGRKGPKTTYPHVTEQRRP